MKFVRIFRSGEEYDPRSHKVAVWKCDVCGHDHWEDHIQESTYNKMAEKKCPKCGSLSVEDRVHALKLRLPDSLRRKQIYKRKLKMCVLK